MSVIGDTLVAGRSPDGDADGPPRRFEALPHSASWAIMNIWFRLTAVGEKGDT